MLLHEITACTARVEPRNMASEPQWAETAGALGGGGANAMPPARKSGDGDWRRRAWEAAAQGGEWSGDLGSD